MSRPGRALSAAVPPTPRRGRATSVPARRRGPMGGRSHRAADGGPARCPDAGLHAGSDRPAGPVQLRRSVQPAGPVHPAGRGPRWPARQAGRTGAPGGAQARVPGCGAPGKVNRFAVASLILGLLGITVIGAIAGIVLGILALGQIRRTGQRGRGLAIAGLAFSALWLVLLGAYFVLHGGSKSPVAAARVHRAQFLTHDRGPIPRRATGRCPPTCSRCARASASRTRRRARPCSASPT